MSDYLVRAAAADAQVRAFAVTARDTVETARKAHDTSPVMTAALGRLRSMNLTGRNFLTLKDFTPDCYLFSEKRVQ